MGRMLRIALGLIFALAVLRQAHTDEKIALRTATGKFVGVSADGSVHADRILPGPQETLLLQAVADGLWTFQVSEGRSLASGPGGRVRSVVEAAKPEQFKLVRSEANRVAVPSSNGWLVFDAAAATPAVTLEPPRAEHTVEMFRVAQVPTALQGELGRLIRKAVQEELGGDGYDKDRIRKKQKFVKLPAPTLHDWKRQQRYRVLSMAEEYHVHVQLAGEPDVRLVEMPYLQGYFEPALGSVFFRVEATLPLDGRVRYKIPNALSASTGFRTVLWLRATGELRSAKDSQKGQTVLQPPKLLELKVEIRELDVSNDALNLVHEALKDMINEELQEKNDRMREKANRSIQKAVTAQKFHAPMLEWLLRTPGM